MSTAESVRPSERGETAAEKVSGKRHGDPDILWTGTVQQIYYRPGEMVPAGRPVVALAQSVKASREVLRQEAGFATADTVARFLKDEEMQKSARGGVVLVDEASQLGTRDMLRVFDVAEAVGARSRLVGASDT